MLWYWLWVWCCVNFFFDVLFVYIVCYIFCLWFLVEFIVFLFVWVVFWFIREFGGIGICWWCVDLVMMKLCLLIGFMRKICWWICYWRYLMSLIEFILICIIVLWFRLIWVVSRCWRLVVDMVVEFFILYVCCIWFFILVWIWIRWELSCVRNDIGCLVWILCEVMLKICFLMMNFLMLCLMLKFCIVICIFGVFLLRWFVCCV